MMMKMMMIMIMVMMCLTAKVAYGQPTPGCSSTCGNLTDIPYPFGTSLECAFDETFLIACNNTENGGQQAYFPNSDIAIRDISLANHEMRVSSPIARACSEIMDNKFMITQSKFPISSKRNVFIALGCDTVGMITSPVSPYAYSNASLNTWSAQFRTGCLSLCDRIEEIKNGTCMGSGCCQMSIPDNVIDFSIIVESMANHSHPYINIVDFNPCDYSFVVEVEEYNFSSSDLLDFHKRETVPVVLDWAVGNQTCEQVNKNSTSYACQSTSSQCHNSSNGSGYRCKCQEGYQGNPYSAGGCQDINECEESNPCVSEAKCINLVGGVKCKCRKGFKGDGLTSEKGCVRNDDTAFKRLAIATGICLCLSAVLIGASLWIYWGIKRRRFMKLKEKFFKQNGGLLLQQQLSDHRESVEMTKIFSAEELEKATNNYDENVILGQGSFGTVYRGVLSDNKVVAIKKSKICGEKQIETFVNEVIVLSRINHRNVVKLLGCCLETEVPLLVYEFITNGTLYSHIHDRKQGDSSSVLSWQTRIKIAIEISGALSYLHSETFIPIIHRDVKTANILLDEDYTAKISDFGTSRLIPIDESQLTTLVRGTFGYLDPEYSQSSQLTEKSDVYSFGVVLVELLTGKQVICFSRPERERNLAMYFVSHMNEDRLLDILDDQVAVNAGNVEQLTEVANLALKCLRMRGEERPTMKEVTAELQGIMQLIIRYK